MTITAPHGFLSHCILGCGERYEALITGRGGTSTLQILEPSSISWSRSLDAVSTASVTVDISCCTEVIASLHAWHHELLISRNGEVVWHGPIVELVYTETELEVLAWDVMGYLSRRGIARDLDFTPTGMGATDLTEIAHSVVEEAFVVDDPNVLNFVSTTPSGITGERSYSVNDVDYALDYINELARTGIDYTVIGRRIILAGETPIAQLGTFTIDHFTGELRVIGAGQSLATSAVVIGDGVIGRAGGTDEFYGLVEIRSREESIQDQISADAAAQARVTAGYPMPLIIDASSASQFDPSAPVCINHLVPGVKVNIQLDPTRFCRPVSTAMRLIQLSVSVGSDGEKVSPRFTPLNEVA